MLFIRRLSPLFRRFRSTVYCCQKIERCDKKSSTGVCARSVASSPSIVPLSICLVGRSSKMLSVFEEALCGAHFRHAQNASHPASCAFLVHTQECCLCSCLLGGDLCCWVPPGSGKEGASNQPNDKFFASVSFVTQPPRGYSS